MRLALFSIFSVLPVGSHAVVSAAFLPTPLGFQMNMTTKSNRTSTRRLGIAIASLCVAIVGALVAARLFVYEPFRQPSDSMYPTIPSGSFLLVDRRGFSNAGPFRKIKLKPTARIDRGDIVAFLIDDDGTVYIKRVIGLPGDHVRLAGRHLTVNGGAVPVHVALGDRVQSGRFDYQLATETIENREATIAWIPTRPSTDFDRVIPEDHFFMLGDNRDNSRDSRFAEVGFVPKERMIGKVVWVLKPGAR